MQTNVITYNLRERNFNVRAASHQTNRTSTCLPSARA